MSPALASLRSPASPWGGVCTAESGLSTSCELRGCSVDTCVLLVSHLSCMSWRDPRKSLAIKRFANAGATTALLAVFACVCLLSGPASLPLGGRQLTSGQSPGGQVALHAAQQLPGAAQAVMGRSGGRVLTALPPALEAANDSTHARAVEVVRGEFFLSTLIHCFKCSCLCLPADLATHILHWRGVHFVT